MILLSASKINKSYGTDTILNDISFSVNSGDKIGILGVNGAGKTTLFKIISEELDPDSGSIYRSKQLKISYMKQHIDFNSENNAYDEVMTVFADLIKTEKELEILNRELENNPTDELIKKQSFLNEYFIENGGLTYKSMALSALKGLGIPENEIHLPVSVLSGGQRTRVMLAKVLLEKADILFLDEPTNHLDIESISWLEEFLGAYKGSIMLITHDRYFLDKVTNKIFEIEHHKLKEYNGNYSYYITKKTADEAAEAKDYALKEKEVQRLQGIIKQQKQWNREKNIKTAESKQKMIDRIESTMVKPEKTLSDIKFRFNFQEECANDVLITEKLSKSFSGTPLFNNINLDIKKSEKVFLLGPNGSGKSTLFKIILGQQRPDSGKIKIGPRVKIAYYDQTQSDLNLNKTIFNEIQDSFPYLTNTEIRSALALFLFKGEDVFKEISTLSGGEKARVCLVKLMLSKSNILFLDEPTNHLDIKSKEALENALSHYDGTLFVISHDRYFINKLANKIYVIGLNGEKCIKGGYDEYLSMQENNVVKIETVSANKLDYKKQKELDSLKRKLTTKVTRAEETIFSLEEEIENINIKMNDEEISKDYEKIVELTNILEEKQHLLENAMTEWENASKELESL